MENIVEKWGKKAGKEWENLSKTLTILVIPNENKFPTKVIHRLFHRLYKAFIQKSTASTKATNNNINNREQAW